MKVTRKQEKIVQRTLEGWRQEGVIDAAEQQRLQQNLSVQLFDWQHSSASISTRVISNCSGIAPTK